LFKQPLSFQAHADFDLKWGLGSSSTLISLLAQWASVNPYTLLENSFGGSGYDVACATVDHPICYTKKDRVFSYVRLSPAITNKILFVYSGNKQNSKAEIKRYSNLENSLENVDKMNEIIENAFLATSIDAFEKQVLASEQLLANALQLETIQNNHFADYPYAIKSLGAWGGDFFMATFRDEQEARTYFQNRGFNQQFTYSEIIK
jgi:mevalonate kinase